MKKLAVVATGWHFPLHFYKKMAEQKAPPGWEIEFFCVSHRDPSYATEEKKKDVPKLGYDRRGLYDRILYEKIATVAEIESLGWHYTLEPNTIGDWGCSNQWLEKHDYRQYDMFLFTHDDNFMLNGDLFVDLLESGDWLILTNSEGVPSGVIRGSFEFFTREMMEHLGGKFDLSATTLTREGTFTSDGSLEEIGNWNTTLIPIMNLIKSKNLSPRVVSLSPFYRISQYCLEGERGYIHKTYELNTPREERGLDLVEYVYRKGSLHSSARGLRDLRKIRVNNHGIKKMLRLWRMRAGAVKGKIVKKFF